MIYIQLAGALVCCLTASYWDLKEARVPNKLVLTMLVFGLLFAVLRFELHYIMLWAANSGLSFLLAYGLWRFGAWAGGDAKLFWGLVTMVPLFPWQSGLLSAQSSVLGIMIWLALLSLLRLSSLGIINSVRNGQKALLVKSIARPLMVTGAFMLILHFTLQIPVTLQASSGLMLFMVASYRVGSKVKTTVRLAPYITSAFVLAMFFDLVSLFI